MNIIEAQSYVTTAITEIMDEDADAFDIPSIMTEAYDLQGSWDLNVMPPSELDSIIKNHRI